MSDQTTRAIELAIRLQQAMQSPLPAFHFGVNEFFSDPNREHFGAHKAAALHELNGVIIVYLFAIWDSYTEHDYPTKYFRDNEKLKFYAFKHIRHVFAHNIDGRRESNYENRDRMIHARKLDQLMQSDDAIGGLCLTHYKIDLSESNAALDCREFFQNMALKLASGRISVGGPYGKIHVAGGGTTDVM